MPLPHHRSSRSSCKPRSPPRRPPQKRQKRRRDYSGDDSDNEGPAAPAGAPPVPVPCIKKMPVQFKKMPVQFKKTFGVAVAGPSAAAPAGEAPAATKDVAALKAQEKAVAAAAIAAAPTQVQTAQKVQAQIKASEVLWKEAVNISEQADRAESEGQGLAAELQQLASILMVRSLEVGMEEEGGGGSCGSGRARGHAAGAILGGLGLGCG